MACKVVKGRRSSHPLRDSILRKSSSSVDFCLGKTQKVDRNVHPLRASAKRFLQIRDAVARSPFPLALPVTPCRVEFVIKQSLHYLVFGRAGGEIRVFGAKRL